jgi:stage V sporulation protein S
LTARCYRGHKMEWRSKVNTISVQNNSHTFFVAQEITGLIRENKRAQIEAIGSEAVNRAIKALSVARGHLRAQDITITCVSEDSNVVIEDRYITAIKIVVDPAI